MSRPPGTSADLPAGRRLDRYVVECPIGRGGMGTVYRVRHARLGSVHALKVLHHRSDALRERLLAEGRAQSRLHHPHVVPVTDVVDVDGAPGLIMELIDGPTLFEVLRQRRFTLAEADRLGEQILRAVRAAHRAGVVHRDLNPGNVLLAPSPDGELAKVTDFGLAGPADHAGGAQLAGTPGYMAPERHDGVAAGVRGDVFALGALLYEVVCGEPAFTGASADAIADAVRHGRVTPLRQRVPAAPARMITAIEGALALVPAARFVDVDAMLDAWRGGLPAQLTAEVARASRRRPLRRAGAAVALVAAAAACGLWLAGQVRPDASPGPTEQRLTAMPDDLQTFALDLSHDGSAFAFTNSRGLYVQTLDGMPEQVAAGVFHNVDFFPDGRSVLVSGTLDGEDGVWEVPLDGSPPLRRPGSHAHLVHLSPDGRLVARSGDGGLWVTPLDGRPTRRLRSLDAGETVLGAAWSPDSARLAVVSVSKSDGVSLAIHAADGTSSRTVLSDHRLYSLGMSPLEWVAPDRLLFTRTTREPAVAIHAVEDASVAAPAAFDDAPVLHRWTGHNVVRIRASADGRMLAYSRVRAQRDVYVLDAADPTHRRRLTQHDWNDRPVGWRGNDEVLVVSDVGEGGLFAHRLDAAEGTPLLPLQPSHRVHVDGDALLYWTDCEDDDHAAVLMRSIPGGQPTEVLRFDPAPPSSGWGGGYDLRCLEPDRCLLAEPSDGVLVFRWFDPRTRTLSDPVARADVGNQAVSWDIAVDGRRLALLTARQLEVHDLADDARTVWPLDLTHPMQVAWAPSGEQLYLTGLAESREDPYFLSTVDADGVMHTLWSSATALLFAPTPSPDGRHLAIGVYEFDDDAWLLRDLPEG